MLIPFLALTQSKCHQYHTGPSAELTKFNGTFSASYGNKYFHHLVYHDKDIRLLVTKTH